MYAGWLVINTNRKEGPGDVGAKRVLATGNRFVVLCGVGVELWFVDGVMSRGKSCDRGFERACGCLGVLGVDEGLSELNIVRYTSLLSQ
jgi:hypothetical protein